ncbi:NADH:ubiquinone oxidoreductase 18 kDa subunit [Volvox carteri f. nagariensis]|uniref:NADH:ubiquinone oxidoreductase 18 kDa subunit n=1 Tax=Volvox carteri f. nagariensis TaxID=3068 RepID=D8TS48_VOLCA|nr:NADH:ubiquinone oxidoreductase 18 kDa subunit [Volvox carteri f. nagariensis]EFJ49631.1 NADH:ubiquinone oxidoreductase 18 kDa subunit [Volvox carteri f. nagariensis]|eukprot:XP_002949138.1 NADH:ubiquinone oxidoreductase 18 kDa subunit [Volvox carteri f. nagariensis]
MLRQLSFLLPGTLRSSCGIAPVAFTRSFKAVADVEIDFNNREVLKKYVGIRDHLSKKPGTRGALIEALSSVLNAIKAAPEASDYRKAVEATCSYRMKVCQENESDAAIEEVLDAHLEELIKECKEEERLVSYMLESKAWDVPADYSVPVVDYVDAATVLEAKK